MQILRRYRNKISCKNPLVVIKNDEKKLCNTNATQTPKIMQHKCNTALQNARAKTKKNRF